MGKAGRNEMKKIAAGFLNGVAIAILATGCLAPAFGQTQWALSALIAAGLSLAVHILALAMVHGVED